MNDMCNSVFVCSGGHRISRDSVVYTAVLDTGYPLPFLILEYVLFVQL